MKVVDVSGVLVFANIIPGFPQMKHTRQLLPHLLSPIPMLRFHHCLAPLTKVQTLPILVLLEGMWIDPHHLEIFEFQGTRCAGQATRGALWGLLEIQQECVRMPLLHLPQPFLPREAQGFVLPRQNAIGEDIVDGDVGAEVKRPREDFGHCRFAGERDDAYDLGWNVLHPAREDLVASGKCRWELVLDNRDTLVSEALHVVLCADAQDAGEEGDER